MQPNATTEKRSPDSAAVAADPLAASNTPSPTAIPAKIRRIMRGTLTAAARNESAFLRRPPHRDRAPPAPPAPHFNSNPTGQWSLPITCGSIHARLNRGFSAADAIT